MNTTLRDPMNTGRPLRAGFIGVGTMGQGMVMNLRRNGFAVMFLARETAGGRTARERLSQAGATPTGDPAELARASDVVILCLPDSPTVESILTGPDGLKRYLRAGSIVIDCSTSHPASTRRLAEELAVGGVTLLDGPLTGSRAQADAGTLNVLGAGPLAAFEKARPVMLGFAARVFHLGDTGSGHAAKLINNFLGLLALAGLCEVWPLLEGQGIDRRAFFDAISASGGNSATFQGAFPKLEARSFSRNFAQKLGEKDVRYLAQLVHAAGGQVHLADCLHEVFESSLAAGFGESDTSELVRYFDPAQRAPGKNS